MSQSIRVALSGGGLASATLLFALLPPPSPMPGYARLPVSFRFQASAAMERTRNAWTALELISRKTTKCLERAGALAQRGVRPLRGETPRKEASSVQ